VKHGITFRLWVAYGEGEPLERAGSLGKSPESSVLVRKRDKMITIY